MGPEEAARADLQPLVDLVRRGEYDGAITGLKDYLLKYPHHEVGMGLLASAYFQIGMNDRAKYHYEQMLARYPGNALARFQLGLVLLNVDPRQALQVWRPLLAVEEEFMAHFHAALAHLQLDDPAAALPLLDHAAKYMPTSHPLQGQLQQLRSSLQRANGLRQ